MELQNTVKLHGPDGNDGKLDMEFQI